MPVLRWLPLAILPLVGCLPPLPEGSSDSGDTDTDIDIDTDTDTDTDTSPASDFTASNGAGMMLLPADSFDMGSGRGDPRGDYPDHDVTLTHDFWMGRTEITRDQWEHDPASEDWDYYPSSTCGGDCPADVISWYDAARYANWLSAEEGLDDCYSSDGTETADANPYDCSGYRLPTEAEWEYAARAGLDTTYSGGDDVNDVAWTSGNSGDASHPVCTTTQRENAWALCDMSGNLWEWTNDWYGSPDEAPMTNPTGAASGSQRAFRGGSWSFDALSAQVAARNADDPGYHGGNFGFRLARSKLD